jgi:hypothetical protein
MPAPKRSRQRNAGKGQQVMFIEAPCADCMRETLHNILHATEVNKSNYVETFETLQCRGCSRVSLRETTVIKDGIAFYEKPRLVSLLGLETFRTMTVAHTIRVIQDLKKEGRVPGDYPRASEQATSEEKSLPPDARRLFDKPMQEANSNPSEWLPKDTFIEFYPPQTSRRRPDWTFPGGIWFFEEEGFLEIFDEIYVATRNRLPHLAIMGIRAVLEQVMIKNNGRDYGNFPKNLQEFEKNGFVSKVERESLEPILKTGHAVIHRSFKVNEEELDIALNIMEGILAAIYYHREPAKELRARVPPRRS